MTSSLFTRAGRHNSLTDAGKNNLNKIQMKLYFRDLRSVPGNQGCSLIARKDQCEKNVAELRSFFQGSLRFIRNYV